MGEFVKTMMKLVVSIIRGNFSSSCATTIFSK